MQISQLPAKWFKPFAADDPNKVELPLTSADPTRASQSAGFPPMTMQPPESGGVPPQGEDFNGGMNQVARIVWWRGLAGGAFAFDNTWATNAAINGYPQGAKIATADLQGEWINTADNNTVNPDTTGTNWVPGFNYGSTSLAGLTNANVTLTPAQAAKPILRLAGTLTGNIQIIFPNWVMEWVIINNCTGAFTVTCKTAAGSGIVVSQGGGSQIVWGDGTNLNGLSGNSASPLLVGTPTLSTHAAQFGQTSGRLLRKLVYKLVAGVLNVSVNGGAFTTVGASTYVPGSAMSFCIAKVQGAGASGAGCSLPSAGNVNCGSPGGAGSYGESLFTLAQIGASQAITVGLGGVATVGGNGAAGGSSSLGSLLTAPGGIPGTQTGNAAPPVVQGNGNFSTAPTGANLLSVRGTGGTVTMAPSGGAANGSIAGNGGLSVFGPGGSGPAGNNSGISAVNFGTGGSGSVTNNGFGGNSAGGAGGDGIIIIEEYA